MSERDILPVNRLSESARLRITDNVVKEVACDKHQGAELPRAGQRYRLGVAMPAMAAAALVVLFFFVLRQSDSAAPVSSVGPSNEVTRVVAGQAASTVTIGTSKLTVEAESAVVVRGDDERGIEVGLETGTVLCQVAPRGGRPPFQVVAGEVRVIVVGTEFAVSRTNHLVQVEVESGVVLVIADGNETLVHAKERWSSEQDTVAPNPDTVVPTDEAKVVVNVPPRPKSQLPKARVKRPPPRPRHAPAPATSPPKPELAKTQERESDGDRYRQAASLERNDPSAALALYHQIEKGGGSWAASALFARARLQLDRGQTVAAKELLSRYLRLYPRGANAAMASRLLSRPQK